MVFGLGGWIISALEGAVDVGGLIALGAGLYGLGIPKDSILQYVKTGKFLVVARGTTEGRIVQHSRRRHFHKYGGNSKP